MGNKSGFQKLLRRESAGPSFFVSLLLFRIGKFTNAMNLQLLFHQQNYESQIKGAKCIALN